MIMERILSRDKVVDRTNRCLNIFEHYLQRKLTPSTKFLNPLYNDTKPGCNVYLCPRSNTYKLYDQGSHKNSGDAYFFVGRLYGVCDRTNFVDVLRIINRDMGLGIKELEYNFNPNQFKKMIKSKAAFAITPENNNSTPKKIDKRFTLKEQPFKDHEVEYWMSYVVT